MVFLRPWRNEAPNQCGKPSAVGHKMQIYAVHNTALIHLRE